LTKNVTHDDNLRHIWVWWPQVDPICIEVRVRHDWDPCDSEWRLHPRRKTSVLDGDLHQSLALRALPKMLDEPSGSPALFASTCIARSWPISSAPSACLGP